MDLWDVDHKLALMGARMVVCSRDPESYDGALSERLKVTGNPSQYRDMDAILNTQRRLLEFAERSTIPFHTLDVTNRPLSDMLDEVVAFLDSSGGWFPSSVAGTL
jgi:hypothetical protein